MNRNNGVTNNGVTRDFLAQKYNVSTRTINEWARAIDGAKNPKTGLYNLDAFELFTANRASCSKSFQDLQAEKIKAEIRKLSVESDSREFDLAIKRGEFVPLEEAIADLTTALTICRSRFLAMPSKLATSLGGLNNPKEISAILEEEIHQNLQAIAENLAKYEAKKNPPLETDSHP